MKFKSTLGKYFRKTPLFIGITYAVISALWILITDDFLAQFIKNPDMLTEYQTYKGWMFVLTTAVLLFLFIRRIFIKIETSTNAVIENENKYGTILEQAVEGIIISDGYGNIKEANRAALEILDYDSDSLIKFNLRDLVVKEDLETQPLRFQDLYSGNVVLTERKLVKKSGSIISAEVSAKMLSTGYIVIIFRDITARKRMENELRESEQEYRLLFRNNPHPMWVYDTESLKFLAVNNSALVKYGYTHEEFLNKTIRDIRPEEEILLLEKNIEEDKSYFQRSGPWRHQKKDGTIFFVDIISNALIFQGRNARLVMADDITDRKKTLEALAENEKRYRNLFEQSPISIWEQDFSIIKIHIDLLKRTGVIDFKNYLQQYPEEIMNSFSNVKILDINTATLKLFEAETKEELLLLLPDTSEISFNSQRETIIAIAEGRKHFEFEKEIRTLKGNLKYVDLKWTVADGYEKTYSKVFVSLMDITERKAAEEALKARSEELKLLNEELEQRVMNRTSLLESSNKELEAFGYSVSHDLRAPLRRIDGFVNILKEENANRLSDDGKNLITTVLKNIREMQDLIDALLSFSRFAAKELTLKKTDMNEMAQRIKDELMIYEKARNIKMNVNQLPSVYADSNLIQQVWINLISNALKFTRHNPDTIINIDSYIENGFTIFKVSDNGIGFNPLYTAKLFDVFQRLHKKEEFEGSGVGLAIVKRIVTRHGGKVWADSEPGKGACFFFSLPNIPENQSALAKPQ